MALSNAQKKVAQRQRAREAGVCIVCFVNDARAGLATCKPCNDDAKLRVKNARKDAKRKRRKK